MGTNTLLAASDTNVEVAVDAAEDFPSDGSPALRDETGPFPHKRRVRIAVAFDGDPPSNDATVSRLIDDSGDYEVAVAQPDGTLSGPGGSAPVNAGVWTVDGPVPSDSFVRIINDGGASAFTLTEVVVYWEDV